MLPEDPKERVTQLAIREILDKIDDTGLAENLLKELDEEIRSLKLKDRSITVDQAENMTVRIEIKDGKRRIVKTITGLPPISVIYEVEGPHTPFSTIRKYVTKKNIEDLLFSE
jgi:hypothetical protein